MMGQIKDVISEPIEGHEQYHIMVSWCCFGSFRVLEPKAMGQSERMGIPAAVVLMDRRSRETIMPAGRSQTHTIVKSETQLRPCFHAHLDTYFSHFQGLQLGPTEASRYWLYWVPAQYVAAIKEAIIG